jgi:hypothetical protein
MNSPAPRRPGAPALWVCALLAALCAFSRSSSAQAPNEPWRTIRTENFYIHFPVRLELVARRTGAEAERAFSRLSRALSPPRTPIDVVVTDDQDVSNGQAGYTPYSRIVIWAHPPIDNAALRFGDDWLQQVVTHEVAHIFHLDRARGIWRLAQFVFGRHAASFPNARSPRWLTIGSGGRLNGTELYAALDATAPRRAPTPGRLSIASPYWPGGDIAYFGGGWIVAEAMRAGGDTSMKRFIDRAAVFPIPYLWDLHAKRAFGKSFDAFARDASTPRGAEAATTATVRSKAYWDARSPRWRGDSIYFTATGPRDVTGLFVAHGTDVDRVERRNSTDAFSIAGDHIIYAQLDFTDPYRLYSALYRDGSRIDGTAARRQNRLGRCLRWTLAPGDDRCGRREPKDACGRDDRCELERPALVASRGSHRCGAMVTGRRRRHRDSGHDWTRDGVVCA